MIWLEVIELRTLRGVQYVIKIKNMKQEGTICIAKSVMETNWLISTNITKNE